VPKTFESAHPYPNSADLLEDVTFPGATEISIVFDSACRSEANYDYLRFLKARGGSEYWGEEKYHGTSWPALTIPADSFCISFHSDGR
jgi:hypothetical protein